MRERIIQATLVAGTLDILSAFIFAGMAGMSPLAVLQFVASGPFGGGAKGEPAWLWALVGLAVHFAIIACMAAAYMAVARRSPSLRRHPILAGLLYGLLLWIIMYWLVRPTRWPALWLPDAYAGQPIGKIAWGIGNQLFSHCILVGLPIARIAARRAYPSRIRTLR
ncbi:hypothetical protein MOK15_01650 [Sphingobium sp. BYY-5]|uniref:hypothetical protein n=1 Tax=Sphingobium sp. BYY-5 TaxID=2926400 RepID=UPI001FA78818|nr:hypothetical protein [Sphingobium sp. BYY-5]MCI4588814.1 hypothetical protein [Sphingobium sp. BYY-5]